METGVMVKFLIWPSIIFLFFTTYFAFADEKISLDTPIDYLTAQAIAGNADAQTILGMRYAFGLSVKQDVKIAAEWYRAAANQGHAGAQMNIARLYETGDGVEQNDVRAFEWFQKSAEQGHEPALAALGDMYKEGRGIAQDLGKAEVLYKQSKKHRKEIEKFERFKAERNAKKDQNHKLLIGLQYAVGDGVPKDYQKAAEVFYELAEEGNDQGQYFLGMCYRNGQGVAQDYKKAVKWLRKSAEQNNSEAQKILGLMDYAGERGSQDYYEAAKWFKKAAINGDQFSMHTLGYLYSKGLGVPQSYEEANTWYQKAIDNSTDPETKMMAKDQMITNKKLWENARLGKQENKELKLDNILEKIKNLEKEQRGDEFIKSIQTPATTNMYCYRIGNAVSCKNR